MSTKIYYGVSIATSDLKEVLRLVRQYHDEHWLKDAYEVKKKFMQIVLSECKNPEEKDEEGINKLSRAESLWWELRREIKKTGLRNTVVDTDFQLVVFPYEDKFLGIVYTERGEWFEKFLKMPGVSEYGYWDNTDPLEDVTEEEWEARREAWDTVLPGIGIPSMNGFTIDIHDPYGPGIIPKAELIK